MSNQANSKIIVQLTVDELREVIRAEIAAANGNGTTPLPCSHPRNSPVR